MLLDGKRFYIIFNQVNIGVSTAASIPNADQDRLDAASISSHLILTFRSPHTVGVNGQAERLVPSEFVVA
jgi:hypothetical protein